MRRVAMAIGILWMGALVVVGLWLGFGGLFFGVSGIVFKSGFGDIWILAIYGIPGYLLWRWGAPTR